MSAPPSSANCPRWRAAWSRWRRVSTTRTMPSPKRWGMSRCTRPRTRCAAAPVKSCAASSRGAWDCVEEPGPMTETPARQDTEADELSAMVIDQADRLFRGEVTKERMAEADGGEWPSAISEAIERAGLALALVPEARGGVGLPPVVALRLIRRSGYHTLPVPLAETMIAAALWSQVSGATVAGTMSLAPAGMADAIGIERSAGGYVLQGRAQRIPWG